MSDFQGILDAFSDSVLALDEQLNIVAFNAAATQVFVPQPQHLKQVALQTVLGDRIEEQKLITSAGLYKAVFSSASAKTSSNLGLTVFISKGNANVSSNFAVVELRVVKEHPSISWLLVFKGIEDHESTSVLQDEEISKQALKAQIEKLRAEQKIWLSNFHELQLSIEQQVIAQQAVLLSKETELLQQINKLEKENRELEQFNYLVIHDLQEPLRSMLGFSDLINAEAEKGLYDQAQTYLKYITDSAKRMQGLVDGLLKYATLGNESEMQLVDCNVLMDEVNQDLAAAIAESGVKIYCSNLPVVSAYPTELKSVFLNLISNAIKFRNQKQEASITISANEKGNFWRFEVRDNGIGIDAKHHKNLFGLFKRFHRQANIQGTGIGLALCKKVIALHKGEIWVESHAVGGTSFCFTLPK
jgi:signal transduction histidine kinase